MTVFILSCGIVLGLTITLIIVGFLDQKDIMEKIIICCENCNRQVFGFWKYGINKVCSKNCFRKMINTGKIAKLFPERGYPELGISAPINGKKI